MIGATFAIGFVSVSVWAHHMFAVGMSAGSNIFFVASTMLVGIPTGIKIFNWLATMYGGKLRFDTPMLFCIGFLFQFLIAGLTGIMLAAAPFNWQLTDSYFVVAHFHYTLIGGCCSLYSARFYYWFPKATGRMLSETLGKWHFWLLVIGFHLTFDPLHFAGLLGMPRRIYTYAAGARLGRPEPGGVDWRDLSSRRSRVPDMEHHPARFGKGHQPATIRGTRGRSSGPRHLRLRNTTSPPCPRCAAAVHCGI